MAKRKSKEEVEHVRALNRERQRRWRDRQRTPAEVELLRALRKERSKKKRENR